MFVMLSSVSYVVKVWWR